MTDKTKKILCWGILILGLTIAMCFAFAPWFVGDNDWFKVGMLAGEAVAVLALPLQPITDKMIEYANGGGCSVVMALCLVSGGILEVFTIDHFTPGIIAALVASFSLLAVGCVLVYRWGNKIKALQKAADELKNQAS